MDTRRASISFMKNAKELFLQNARELGMYIALVVIVITLTIATKGVFISPRNISNLMNQTGYIVVLAVGMTLVIIIRHIDLSVGYLSGFLGAVAGIILTRWHFPVYLTIPIILGFGVLAGLVSGFLIAQMKIPAFVATLAGWLGYRGALQLATMAKGTIVIPNASFNAISNGFIPDILDIGILPGVHKLTLILGILAIILFIISAIRDRRKMLKANKFRTLKINFFILKLVVISAIIGGITWLFATYRGFSWTVVVLLVVILSYNFIMSQTVLGRHIYAVGGNPEAAELSGINVKKITYVVFCSMGMLAALSGIMFASRLRSATTTAGQLFELDAIAAAFVGGVSMSGGIGRVTGSFIGAFIMMSLTSGMNLMGIDISLQYIVRATVLAAAVIFDVAIRRREK